LNSNDDVKGALYEVLRAEADHCADLLRQGKGPVLAYPDGMQLATLLGKAADEIERLRKELANVQLEIDEAEDARR
jgi:hypothetical protein